MSLVSWMSGWLGELSEWLGELGDLSKLGG